MWPLCDGLIWRQGSSLSMKEWRWSYSIMHQANCHTVYLPTFTVSTQASTVQSALLEFKQYLWVALLIKYSNELEYYVLKAHFWNRVRSNCIWILRFDTVTVLCVNRNPQAAVSNSTCRRFSVCGNNHPLGSECITGSVHKDGCKMALSDF